MKSGLLLRDVRESDHQFLVELHNDPLVLKNLTDPRQITMESHLRWWAGLDRRRENRLVFEVDGKRAGFCKFSHDRQNHSVCLGADIHASFRGLGLANPMWTLMLDHVFADDTHRAWLTTASYNVIAQRVYTKIGFVEEGKLEQSLFREGVYRNQIVMRIFRHDWFKRRADTRTSQ